MFRAIPGSEDSGIADAGIAGERTGPGARSEMPDWVFDAEYPDPFVMQCFPARGVMNQRDNMQNPEGESGEAGVSGAPETGGVASEPLTRRRFVQGAAAGAACAMLGSTATRLLAENAAHYPAELSGTHFELTIDRLPVNFTGHAATAIAVNGSVPGPLIRWREGDTVTLAVTNRMRVPTSIHWHSLRVPTDMDGVPGLSFPGIAPGETFVYRFPVKQHGTAWYHSHTRFQEQSGLSGPLIIEPRGPDPIRADRDYVVFLTDWTDTNPETVFSNLKEDSDYYNYQRRTLGNFVSTARRKGWWRTLGRRMQWARMNMSPTDILDVTGATYTYLMNGNPPNANWTGLFEPGERVRLRFINGSSMTAFDVRIPGLKLVVVEADGNEIEPVPVDEFRINVAETYDAIVEPREDKAYTIFAAAEDHSGFARGTLATKLGMTAPIPRLGPAPVLSMMDMGMGSMKGMKMGSNMVGIDGMTSADVTGGSGKDAKAAGSGSMAGMGMGSMGMGSMPPGSMSSGSMGKGGKGMSMGAMGQGGDAMAGSGGGAGMVPFPQPGPGVRPLVSIPEAEIRKAEAQLKPSNPVHLHVGPEVDNVAKRVTERLNSAGVGLEHTGRRVLTYADLRARYEGTDGRAPTQEIELHLTGNMSRFIWGFNGERFSESNPIVLRLGERVRFVLVNDTMMEHPIHLHGMWSELENGHGRFNPYKHTVSVKPAERVSYLVSADTPGRWAFHCHLLYHMQAGMFRTVVVLA
jgi:CopA family copper-resistance protein